MAVDDDAGDGPGNPRVPRRERQGPRTCCIALHLHDKGLLQPRSVTAEQRDKAVQQHLQLRCTFE